jgi:hypothetical protein
MQIFFQIRRYFLQPHCERKDRGRKKPTFAVTSCGQSIKLSEHLPTVILEVTLLG